MSKRPTVLILSPEDRFTLEGWVRAGKTGRRLAERARLVLAAADGQDPSAIARSQHLRSATVSKWRVRFAQSGLVGLRDAPRPGAAPRYDAGTKRRILTNVDEAPPSGYATRTGSQVAEAPGDVSKHQVWRVLAAESIHPQRRRGWCIGTDPQFAVKAADVVGLYLDPPESAVILSVDVKPLI